MLLTGCVELYVKPIDYYVRTYETELKEEFPYVMMFHLQALTPPGPDWSCTLKHGGRESDDFAELVEYIKEFTLEDEVFEVLVETRFYSTRDYINSVTLHIYEYEKKGTRKNMIYIISVDLHSEEIIWIETEIFENREQDEPPVSYRQ